MRLLGSSQTIIHCRPIALAAALVARLGLIEAVAFWPDASNPILALDLADRTSRSWALPTLPRHARATGSDPRAWQAVRARALVLPRGRSVAVCAAERALGRALARPSVSFYSPSASAGKLTCFIGERGASEPAAVVKAMAQPADAWWLRRELATCSVVRGLLEGERAGEALLAPPLFAAELEGEFMVVESFQRLDRWCGPAARRRAHSWLREFQRATTREPLRWSDADTAEALAKVLDGWRLLRPARAAAVAASTRRMLDGLRGVELPRCATHGDFAPGNIGEAAGQLKVFDWEWARLDGDPQFDLWSYELAELHRLRRAGSRSLQEHLERAVGRVRIELELAGCDPRFARASLPTVLAEHVVRVRRTLGHEGVWERSSGELMVAVERLLGAPFSPR